MGTRNDLQDILVEWVRRATGLAESHVLIQGGKFIKPSLPYATIQLSMSDVPGYRQTRRFIDSDGALREQILKHVEGAVTVIILGKEGEDLLWLLEASLSKFSIKNFLHDKKVVVRSDGGVRDISLYISTELEPRYTRDFSLTYAVITKESISEIVPSFDSLDFELELKKHDDDQNSLTNTFKVE